MRGGGGRNIALVVVVTKAEFHCQISCGVDIKYPALNNEIAWITNIVLKCSHTDGGTIPDGFTSQPAVSAQCCPVKGLFYPQAPGYRVESDF